jgi:adenine/guanine/hypoxanthine permease
MNKFINNYFDLEGLQTNIRTEILAGVSTYLSLAYIFVVNPAILANSGMNVSAVLFATVIASGISTLLMGFVAKLPFALAPGLEMNGFFAFVVCGTLGLTWEQALGTVFWSGILCIFFTWVRIRQQIIDAIPDGLKTNIAVSVGIFVATIGLFLSKVIVFKDGFPDFSQWNLQNLISNQAIVLFIGLFISVILGIKRFRFTGGMLVAIIVSSVICKFFGITAKTPASISPDMLEATFKFDLFSVFTDARFMSVLLIFFIIDFFGSIGKFIGLTAATNLQSNGQVKNIEKAMYVDGVGTVIGSAVGTSSIITYVESAVGIAAGGRSGITAIVCGMLMLISIAFTPLVGFVPVEATAGILLYVGWLLLPIRHIRETTISFGRFDIFVAIVMGLLSLFTFSLDKAMLFGFWAYSGKQIFSKTEKVNFYLLGVSLILTIAVVVQFLWK